MVAKVLTGLFFISLARLILSLSLQFFDPGPASSSLGTTYLDIWLVSFLSVWPISGVFVCLSECYHLPWELPERNLRTK
jgi:hypothetical protein